MSAVVKKSLLCCLNKKRLYLGAVRLPLFWLEAVAARTLGPLRGFPPRGQISALREFTRSQGTGCFLMAVQDGLERGCSLLLVCSVCGERGVRIQLGIGACPDLDGWWASGRREPHGRALALPR